LGCLNCDFSVIYVNWYDFLNHKKHTNHSKITVQTENIKIIFYVKKLLFNKKFVYLYFSDLYNQSKEVYMTKIKFRKNSKIVNLIIKITVQTEKRLPRLRSQKHSATK